MKSFIKLSLILFLTVLLFSCKKENGPGGNDLLPEVLPCNYFNSDRVLVNDPNKPIDYIIECVMSISGSTISIEPGVVIHFTSGAGIAVTGTGGLKAAGTSNQQIVFSSANRVPGSWKGLFFNSPSVNNILEHCNVVYAGESAFNSNGDVGAVIVWASARLKIHNTNISHSGSFGINAIYTESNIDHKSNSFKSNLKAPLKLSDSYWNVPDSESDYAGNSEDFIYLEKYTSNVGGEKRIQKLNVPYRLHARGSFAPNIVISGNVIIDPGVVVEFRAGSGINVNSEGSLQVSGTSADPVLFTGVDKLPAAWAGIQFSGSTNVNNRISNAIIEFTGNNQQRGAIRLNSQSRLNVDNVLFKDLESCAIFNTGNPANVTTNNLTYLNVGGQICTN